MERRVFIAIILSFLVIYAYQGLFMPAPPPAAAKNAPASAAPATPGAAAATASAAVATPAPVAAAAPEPQALISETSEREIIVDTETVQAVLTNRGGRLLHWRLKNYRDARGNPVDLVPSGLPPTEQIPFALRVDDAQSTTRLNNAVYRVSGDSGGHVDAAREAAAVSFEYQDAAGLHSRKDFRFDPSNYIVSFSATVTSGDRMLNPTIVWGPGLGDSVASPTSSGFFNRNPVVQPEVILHRAGKVERVAITKLGDQPAQDGQFLYAGVDDHYFMVAVVKPGQARFEYRPLIIPGPANSNTQRELISQAVRFPQPPMNVRFFVGPKQFELLRSIDGELVRAVNYGMFGFLAVPLLSALKWIHGFVGNYGWSIILLTVLINLAMFPLRHKSVISMRKMQALQPQLKAIQDRYAALKVTDPARQKMNTEVMNLYREKGVNPASGCVPILLTMPVLLAFYALLGQSIELRGAEFGWWIHDLSQADPYYVLPVLVTITMVWQQTFTPAGAMDPAQQKMMMFMPIMFGFIFLTAASGTVLYWLIGNVWTIAQQYFTTWLIGPPTVPTARPAAERQLKNAGTGRTAGAEKHS